MMQTLLKSSRHNYVKFQIYIWRYGWISLVFLSLMAIVIALSLGWLPAKLARLQEIQKQFSMQTEEFQRMKNMPASMATPSHDAEVLVKLSERSYAESDVSLLLQLITQIAQAKGLSLAQSEFQSVPEGQAGLKQLQITLPVRATYVQIRQFIQETLRQLDGVSVDQISIKRENVGQNQVEARLKLSLWIDANKLTSRSINTKSQQP